MTLSFTVSRLFTTPLGKYHHYTITARLVAADDQLAKYLALVTEQRAQEANKDTRTAAAATTEATAEEAYADSFEASESAEDSFAAGAGFGGIEAARGSVTPSRTPTGASLILISARAKRESGDGGRLPLPTSEFASRFYDYEGCSF